MITDARSVPAGHRLETDLCIVGAGPAGITIAREFLRGNVQVCLLESGGLDFDAETQALNDGTTVGDPYRNPVETRSRRLGGTAHAWVTLAADGPGARFVPLDAIDFEERSYVPYSGWPFHRTHLDPYYARAQRVCGLGRYCYEADAWVDTANPRLPFIGDRIRTGVYQAGTSRLFTNVYVSEIEQANNVKVYLYANVVELETDEAGHQVTAVRIACLSGIHFSVRAKRFVLACGGIENARLLLLSNRRHPNGLGNQHDLVGRFLMEHPRLFSCDFVPFDPAMFERMGFYDIHHANGAMIGGGLALTEALMRQERLFNVSVIFFPVLRGERSAARKSVRMLREHVRDRTLSVETLRLIGRTALGIGGVLSFGYRRFVRGDTPGDGWSRVSEKARRFESFESVLHLEQTPDPENRVTLGAERDRLGLPKVEIRWRWGALDETSALRAREILAQEIERAGIGRLVIEERTTLQGSVHHHMGTTRMHSDPRKGVVDANCCVHGISNLFVAGSSVFPTGGYANPTLTLVALALRLSDHLQQDLSGRI